MGRANELRRLIALAEQLRGPLKDQVQQVQYAVARRSDPAVQLERKRARLARRRAWAGRWLTFWALITAICVIIAVASIANVIGDGDHSTAVMSIIIGLISATFAARSGLRMRRLTEAREALGPGTVVAPVPVSALPPKGSLAREPMERLAAGGSTLTELLAQITRGGSVPAESVEHP